MDNENLPVKRSAADLRAAYLYFADSLHPHKETLDLTADFWLAVGQCRGLAIAGDPRLAPAVAEALPLLDAELHYGVLPDHVAGALKELKAASEASNGS